MNAQDVDKCLIADDPEFNMNVNEIVQSVLIYFNNTPSFEEIEELEKNFQFWLCGVTNKSKFFRETAWCNFARTNDGMQVASTQ